MLKDSFGRIHDYLRVSLTDRCNFRCLYCLPVDEYHTSAKDKMSAVEIIAICSEFVKLGVRKIRLTGGEPLVRKDAGEIIESLSKLNVKLAITTNGSRIHYFIDALKKSGIHSVNVSLDSLLPANFTNITHKNELNQVMSNINLLISNNFHVKLNMVVMKGYNDNEVPAFVSLTKDAPVHVRFIEFMPFPGNRWHPGKVITYSEILQQVNENFTGVIKMEDGPHDTTKKYRVEGHNGTFAVISTMSEPFCSGCNRLRLTADGKLRNCLFAKTETDLLTPFRNGVSLQPLIESCLSGKHFKLGGNSGNNWGLEETISSKRTMMGIGG